MLGRNLCSWGFLLEHTHHTGHFAYLQKGVMLQTAWPRVVELGALLIHLLQRFYT